MRSPNFLVLDEPTNDLDIVTLQVLEEYLRQFEGCVIIVSHDRYFMDKVVDHILVFKGNGEVKDFPGNYTQYRSEVMPEPAKPKERTATVPVAKVREKTSRRKMSFKERQEYAALEADIAALEAEKQEIVAKLSGASISVDDGTVEAVACRRCRA